MTFFATIGKLRTEEAFQGWIFKILSNKCRKKIRDYSKRTLELTEEILEQQESGELSEHAVIRSLFFTLAEEERMIIAMHLFLGYSSKEMAELLQMNENTLRSKQSRAIKKMVEQYWE